MNPFPAVARHFAWARGLPTWRFLWWIVGERMAVKLVVLVALRLVTDLPDRADLIDLQASPMLFLAAAVIVAPLIETALLQAVPIELARTLRLGFGVQVMIATGLFAAVHFVSGIVTGMVAGLVGGFYLSFTYAHWRGTSRSTAFLITSAAHAINNAILVAIPLAFTAGE